MQVGCKNGALVVQPEVVLEAGAHTMADNYTQGVGTRLMPADTGNRPDRLRRQVRHQGSQMKQAHLGRGRVAQQNVEIERRLDQPLVDQYLGEIHHAQIKNLEFRSNAVLFHDGGKPHHRGRLAYAGLGTEIQRAQGKAGHIRLLLAFQSQAGGAHFHLGGAAPAGRGNDDRIGNALPDGSHQLAEHRAVTARRSIGGAGMEMQHAGPGGTATRAVGRHFLGRQGNVRRLSARRHQTGGGKIDY